jgi:hypothetical protein
MQFWLFNLHLAALFWSLCCSSERSFVEVLVVCLRGGPRDLIPTPDFVCFLYLFRLATASPTSFSFQPFVRRHYYVRICQGSHRVCSVGKYAISSFSGDYSPHLPAFPESSKGHLQDPHRSCVESPKVTSVSRQYTRKLSTPKDCK